MIADDDQIVQTALELSNSGELSNDELAEIEGMIAGLDNLSLGGAFEGLGCQRLTEEKEEDVSEDEEMITDLRLKISTMKLTDKIKLALFGSDIARKILIGDSNKIIPLFVLKNAKIRVSEVEEWVRNPNLSDLVLRAIGNSRTWVKSYKVKIGLVTNAKTPQDLSLKWLRHINEADLKKLSRSKNIPQLIATTARKLLEMKQD